LILLFSDLAFCSSFFVCYASVNRPRDKNSFYQASVVHRTQYIRSHRSPFRSARLPPPQRSGLLCLHTTCQPSHLVTQNIPSLPWNLSWEILQEREISLTCHCIGLSRSTCDIQSLGETKRGNALSVRESCIEGTCWTNNARHARTSGGCGVFYERCTTCLFPH